MSNLHKQFGTDKKKEVEGVWFDITDDIKMLLARYGNPRFKQLVQKFNKPIRSKLRTGTATTEEVNKVLAKAMSQSVVLDWKGVTDESGNVVEYSPEAAYKYLIELPDLMEYLAELSGGLEEYRSGEMETLEGNS